jgi:tRNA(adenine34) deaminase
MIEYYALRQGNIMIQTIETLDHSQWMRRAIQQGQEAFQKGEVPVGCVILWKDQTIIAEAYNQRERLQDPTAHAEIIALRRAAKRLNRWRLQDCTVYVNLEPCFMCAGAMALARVKHVVFGAYDKKGGASYILQNKSTNHQCIVTGGVLEETSSEQLKSFFKIRRQNHSSSAILH